MLEGMSSGFQIYSLEPLIKLGDSVMVQKHVEMAFMFMWSLQERDVSEESGWKLVHGDVFRVPCNLVLLSALVGSGAQLAMLVLLVILLAIVGMLYIGYIHLLYLPLDHIGGIHALKLVQVKLEIFHKKIVMSWLERDWSRAWYIVPCDSVPSS